MPDSEILINYNSTKVGYLDQISKGKFKISDEKILKASMLLV